MNTYLTQRPENLDLLFQHSLLNIQVDNGHLIYKNRALPYAILSHNLQPKKQRTTSVALQQLVQNDQNLLTNCQFPQYFLLFLFLLPIQDHPQKAKYAPLTNHRGRLTSSRPPPVPPCQQPPIRTHLPFLLYSCPTPLHAFESLPDASNVRLLIPPGKLCMDSPFLVLIWLIFPYFCSTYFEEIYCTTPF